MKRIIGFGLFGAWVRVIVPDQPRSVIATGVGILALTLMGAVDE